MTALHDGRRRVIGAVDQAAAALGLRPGMAVAQALAVIPGLQVTEAEPDADARALLRLARWCHRFTPLVSVCAPDGLWLDVTGCEPLFGSEAALLHALLQRLRRDGLHARAAVADTPGAAHAMARHGDAPDLVIPPGRQAAAVAPLPVAALRLAPELEATLRRLGFEQVGHLSRIPRALLARRFGLLVGLRLDQAHGRVEESLVPLAPEHALQHRVAFQEPLLTAEALSIGIDHLVGALCEEMEQHGLGARQLDLLFERVDGLVAGIRIGTARPSRDARHLARLLQERLETVDPGLGVEAMRLSAPLAEPLPWEQQADGAPPQDVARLVDRLTNRLGAGRIYRAAPVASEIPERSVRKEPPGAAPAASDALPFSDPVKIPPWPGPSWPVVGSSPGIDPALHAPATDRVSVMQVRCFSPLAASPPNGVLAWVKPDHDEITTGSPYAIALLKEAEEQTDERLASPDDEQGSVSRAAHLRLVALAPQPPPVLPWRGPWGKNPGGTGRHRKMERAASACPWPSRLQAPARLLNPPRPIEALAALPDQPPVAFTWRRHRHRIRRADGPERIYGEWWRHDAERQSVRDYFQVEDESGQRFWLFRQGNGLDPDTGDLSWFLHGLF